MNKGIIKAIFLFLVLSVSLIFASCDNFLEGSAIRDSIESEIEIAKAPVVSVEFTNGNGGSVTPIGKQSYKLGETFTVYAAKDNDYQFIKWEVYLDNKLLSAEKIASIIDFDEIDNELTDVKFVAEPNGKLVIIPLYYERPVVLGKSPIETPEGSYRDARISILFSQPMDESSIYYSDASELPPGAEPLRDELHQEKIYGYKKDGIKYYKNIEIKDIDTQKSLLDCYGAPYFEPSTRLNIPVKNGNEPITGSQILVNISRNMCSSESGRKVNLNKNEVWDYVVNSSIDADVPLFDSVSVRKYSNKDTELNDAVTATPLRQFTATSVRNLYLYQNKLGVNIKAKDLGSGLNSATVRFQRIFDEKLYAIDNEEIKFKNLTLIYNSGKTNASICESLANSTAPYMLDFSDQPDGVYKVWFTITDVNGNQNDSSVKEFETDKIFVFYVLKHATYSDYLRAIVNTPQNNGNKFFFSEFPFMAADAKVTCSNLTDTSKEQDLVYDIHSDENGIFTIDGLTDCCLYSASFEFTDFLGNVLESQISKTIMTAPAPPTGIEAGIYDKSLFYSKSTPHCLMINDGDSDHTFPYGKDTLKYGRGVKMTAPKLSEDSYVLKYKLYDDSVNPDVPIQDNITSTSFDIDYANAANFGKKEYRISSYLECNGEEVEGPKSDSFIFQEFGTECVALYTAFTKTDNSGQLGLTFTLVYKKDRVGDRTPLQSCKWKRFDSQIDATTFKRLDDNGAEVDYSLYKKETDDGLVYYYKSDFNSMNKAYVYRIGDSENDPNYIEFSAVKAYSLSDRKPQILWQNGYSVVN